MERWNSCRIALKHSNKSCIAKHLCRETRDRFRESQRRGHCTLRSHLLPIQATIDVVLELFIGSDAGVQSLDLVDVSSAAGSIRIVSLRHWERCAGNTSEPMSSAGAAAAEDRGARGFAGGRQGDAGPDPWRRRPALDSSRLLVRVRARSLGAEKRYSCQGR